VTPHAALQHYPRPPRPVPDCGNRRSTAATATNLRRRVTAHPDLFDLATRGETEKAATIRVFYDD